MLSAEELLAGAALTFEVDVPDELLDAGGQVRLRPLSVHDLQLIQRAAKESDSLLATLMVQRALLEPELTVAQVAAAPVGLVQFLLHHVNRISGITATADEIAQSAQAPIARAAFVLSREFGWTPEQVSELTVGQMLLHLQMLGARGAARVGGAA